MLPHLPPLFAVPFWRQLRHLGGVGLIPLGIADNSVVPLTGSVDVLTIWLAARHHEPWPYYAVMATLGAVIGGYITYSLARKGGRETIERKLSKKRAAQICGIFQRWGFSAVAIPALMPPPFPFVPFLLAAGALQYSRKKFPVALTLARGAVLHRRRPGVRLWKTHLAFLLPLQQRGRGDIDRTCRCRYDTDFYSIPSL